MAVTRERFLATVAKAARARVGDVPAPALDSARLVPREADVRQLFVEQVRAAGMELIETRDSKASADIVEVLRPHDVTSVFLASAPLIDELGIAHALESARIKVVSSVKPDDGLFNAGAGITGVMYGLAETGSILLAGHPNSPRQASLVPPIHLALMRESQILADLLDLMAILGESDLMQLPQGMCLVTGPSKSADIELNLVKGVHGPGHEYVVLLPSGGAHTNPSAAV